MSHRIKYTNQSHNIYIIIYTPTSLSTTCTNNISYIHFIILSEIMCSNTNKDDNTLRTEVKIYSLYCQRHHQIAVTWGKNAV